MSPASEPSPPTVLTEDERRDFRCECWQLDGVWQHRRFCPVPAVERILADRVAAAVQAERA